MDPAQQLEQLLQRIDRLDRRIGTLERLENTGGGGGGVTDHGALTGLGDDDHTHYHTDARGDARYAPIAKGVTNGDAHNHAGGDGGALDHAGLTNLNSASYYHLTQAQHTDLTDGGETTLHSHAGSSRETLTANRTYYVRVDGSDANDGLANTSGGAFLTIQKAIDTVATLDINGKTVTIQVGDGSYGGGASLKNVVGFAALGNLVLQGNTTTPGNCLLQVSSGCIAANGLHCAWIVRGFRMRAAGGHAVLANNGSYLSLANLDFWICGGQHIYASRGGIIVLSTGYNISGDANYHILANHGGRVEVASQTMTVGSTPTFSVVMAAQYGGIVLANGMTFVNPTYVTGKRYDVAGNGVIYTAGGGANYIPGTIAGTAATGGQYI